MYPTRFPRNQWYVLARTEELGAATRTHSAGRQVVLFRDESGRPVTLEDRCLYRSMPLSLRALRERGRLQCRYHGDYRTDDPVVDEIWLTGAPRVFAEDIEAIEMVLRTHAPGVPRELNISADAGSLRGTCPRGKADRR